MKHKEAMAMGVVEVIGGEITTVTKKQLWCDRGCVPSIEISDR
jgi:hypothetical protein